MGDLLMKRSQVKWSQVKRSQAGIRVRPAIALILLGAIGVTIGSSAAASAWASGGKGHETPVRGTAAKAVNMTEKASLRLASAPGTTIKEKGAVTGTFKGTMLASFTSYSVSSGGFKLTAYFPGGTLSLAGNSHIRVAGLTGYAEGTARVTGGTGRFAHASGSGLRYRTTVNRRNYYSTTELNGRVSL